MSIIETLMACELQRLFDAFSQLDGQAVACAT
jgi:hypothetical protein